MTRKPVKSTAVRSVGYDADEWVLQVKYAGGDIYNYFRVPATEYQRLIEAPSKGIHMNGEIKPYYEYELVELDALSAG